MNILLTGAGGYLGNILFPKLKDLGHNILPIDLGLFNTGVYNKLNLADKKDYIHLDHLMEDFNSELDVIIHLAGISNDPASELDSKLTTDMNVKASINLLEWSKNRASKVIFASSASVYGINQEVATEDSKLNPQTPYAKSKVIVEELLTKEYSKYFNTIILRFGTLFGVSPKMRFDLAINLMVKNSVINHKLTINGGNQYRPFLHVEDAAGAIIHGLTYDKNIVTNILTSNISIMDLGISIANLLNADIHRNINSEDNRNYRMSDIKMFREFRFSPENHVLYGILSVAKWVEDNKDLVDKDEYYTIRMWKKYYKEMNNGSTVF